MPNEDKRHYVPAGLIGKFSARPAKRLRKSPIAVHRFDGPHRFIDAAENIAHRQDLYRRSIFPGFDNDEFFSTLERNAFGPVDRLATSPSGRLPANEWIKVATYVASQFSRNPSLELRLFEPGSVDGGPNGFADVGYLMNTQRVAAAVYRARWEFIHTAGDLLLNDRAISVVQYVDWALPGYFVPLRRNFGARIAGGPHPKPSRWDGSEWLIDIPRVTVGAGQTDILNLCTWSSAVDEVYGPSLERLADVERRAGVPAMRDDRLADHIEGAQLLTLSNDQRRNDEMLFARLFGGIRKPSPEEESMTVVI